MAASTIQQILTGIKSNLSSISGLRLSDYVPDQVNPPQAVIDFPTPITYHGAFAHGIFMVDPTVTVLVSASIDRVGMTALSNYASRGTAQSIHDAIETDRTLGGKVDDCIVVDFRRLTQQEIDELKMFGGVFTLHVLAKGN